MSYTTVAAGISPAELHSAIEDDGIFTNGVVYNGSDNTITILGTFTDAQEASIEAIISDIQSGSVVNTKKGLMSSELASSRDIGFVYGGTVFQLNTWDQANLLVLKDLDLFPCSVIGKNGNKTFHNTANLVGFASAAFFVDRELTHRYVERMYTINNAASDAEIQDLDFFDDEIQTGDGLPVTISTQLTNPTYQWKLNGADIASATNPAYTFNVSVAGIYVLSCDVDTSDPSQKGLPFTYTKIIKVTRRGI